MNDPVEHPSHYVKGDIEAIDAIKASMCRTAFEGYLKGQVMKYAWRYESKGKPHEDIRKAAFYLRELGKLYEEDDTLT